MTGQAVDMTQTLPQDIINEPGASSTSLWFTDSFTDAIGHVGPSNSLHEFLPSNGTTDTQGNPVTAPGILNGIAWGSDANVWYTYDGAPGSGNSGIGFLDPQNATTGGDFFNCTVNCQPQHLSSFNGFLWAGDTTGSGFLDRFDTNGNLTQVALPALNGVANDPWGAILGPDNKVYVSEPGTNRIAVVNPNTMTLETQLAVPHSTLASGNPAPAAGNCPSEGQASSMGVGPMVVLGNKIYFTEVATSVIGSLTPGNSPTFRVQDECNDPNGPFVWSGTGNDITVGPDGNLWLADDTGTIDSIDPSLNPQSLQAFQPTVNSDLTITDAQGDTVFMTPEGVAPDPTTHSVFFTDQGDMVTAGSVASGLGIPDGAASGLIGQVSIPTSTQQTGVVSGVVTNASTHQPVSNATVVLSHSGTTLSTQHTDSSGAYTFPAEPQGSTYTIAVTPPSGSGLQSETTQLTLSSSTATVNFALPATQSTTSTVHGVISGPGNTLVSGATVQLLQSGSSKATTTSANDGSYSFPAFTPVSGNVYQVKVTAPSGSGLANFTTTAFSVSPGSDVAENITLGAAQPTTAQVKGLVQNSSNSPVQNATVQLLQSGNSIQSTNTASDGSYSFNPITPASGSVYRVKATPPSGSGLSPFTTGTFSLSPGQIQTENITLGAAQPTTAVVTAQVVDNQNHAVGNAPVQLLQNGSQVATGTTGSNGLFQFSPITVVSGATYIIKATAPNGSGLQNGQSPGFNLTGGEIVTEPVVLQPVPSTQAVVTASVVNTSNTAVPNAAVKLLQNGTQVGSGTTGSNGRFTFPAITVLSGASYVVTAVPPSSSGLASGQSQPFGLFGGQSITVPVTLATVPTSTAGISGTVLGPSNMPVQNATVTLTRGTTQVAQVPTSNSGGFSFENLPLNTAFTVSVTPPTGSGLVAPQPQTVTLTHNGQIAELSFLLTNPVPTTGSVVGSVVLPDGHTAANGATVALTQGNSTISSLPIGPAGTFNFTSVTPGSYVVMVTPPSGSNLLPQSIQTTVNPGGVDNLGTIVLLAQQQTGILPSIIGVGNSLAPLSGDHHVADALKSLNRATQGRNWSSNNTLTDKGGKEVFKDLSHAVDQLMHSGGGGGAGHPAAKPADKGANHGAKPAATTQPSSTVMAAITTLVNDAKALASNEITLATQAGGDQHKLAQANKEMTKGNQANSAGKFHEAIDHYGHAYQQAVQSLKHKGGPHGGNGGPGGGNGGGQQAAKPNEKGAKAHH